MTSPTTDPFAAVVVTCEHATCALPAWLRPRFAEPDARTRLHTHRGLDLGAGRLARHLARGLGAPLIAGHISRLAIELNRSQHHRQLFSEITRPLKSPEKQKLIDTYYTPFRTRTRQRLDAGLRHGPVLHLSIHSFTPVLDGQERPLEIGLLYDPARSGERTFAHAWAGTLRPIAPDWRTRMNQPYRGTADGHTTWLRRTLANDGYQGLELEVNQKLLLHPTAIAHVAERLLASLRPLLTN